MNCFFLRAVLLAIAGAPILIACAPLLFTTDEFCNSASHYCLAVSVDPKKNQIEVNIDQLIKQNAGSIRWSIANASGQTFVFPSNGIVFEEGAASGFTCPTQSGGKFFLCSDTTSTPVKGKHKYTITLTGGSSNPKPYDPHVINN